MSANVLKRIASVLWVVWGLVHMLAGVLTLKQSGADAVGGIADAVDKAVLQGIYHPATDAIINQHGFNLLWFGIVTVVGAVYIWRGSVTAIFVTALVGGLADVGYFLFIDLGGFNNFVPGTVMTLVSGSAIVLSFVAHFRGRSAAFDGAAPAPAE